MIPESPTEESIKPVLELMMQSVVYDVATAMAKRSVKYLWVDEVLASLTSNEVKGTVKTYDIEHENITVTCIINNTTDPGPAHGRKHQ